MSEGPLVPLSHPIQHSDFFVYERIIMTRTVNIVEGLCGTGKTTWAIDTMRARPDEKWMFVTPFLDEAGDDDSQIEGRIRNNLPEMCFRTPSAKAVKTHRKKDHLDKLLANGDNISLTHNLFLSINNATLEIIRDQGYNIIVDETIEKVEIHAKLNDKVADIKDLVDNNYIQLHDNGMLEWVGNKLNAYKEEYELCREGRLFLHNDRLLVKKYSSMVYEVANEVYVLTYMFHSSPMRVWFQANKIKWKYLEAELNMSTEQRKAQIRSLVYIEKQEPWIKQLQGRNPEESSVFSSTWFKKAKPEMLNNLRTHANKLYKRWQRRHTQKPNIMFTTFKAFQDDVAGLGTRSVDYLESESSFVAKNARATNNYAGKDCLIYWVNVYPNVDVQMYLNSLVPKKDGLDSDQYALSEMIQWVFRSSLRNEGKKINIYIASERMRKLFQDWLNNDC